MKNMREKSIDEKWEDRELGASEEFVRVVSSERQKAIEKGLGLQMISIRFQKTVIDELKVLAREAGIGYQPYIRRLVTEHVHRHKKRKSAHG